LTPNPSEEKEKAVKIRTALGIASLLLLAVPALVSC
jgi:hypothetical protein